MEVDFFINEQESKTLIQATYSLENSNTRDREIKSLIKAMEEQKLPIGFIYTWNRSEEIKINEYTIKIIPFWEETLK